MFDKDTLKFKLEEMRSELRSKHGQVSSFIHADAIQVAIFQNYDVLRKIVNNEEKLYGSQNEFALDESPIYQDAIADYTILNIGSGWGSLTRKIQQINPLVKIINVDYDKVILDFSKRINEGLGLNNDLLMDYVVCDASDLKLEDAIADELLCMGTLRYLDDFKKKLFIKETLRVVKPGGRIVVTEVDDPSVPVIEAILYELGIRYQKLERNFPIFKQTAFYFYYFMYLNKYLKNVSEIEKTLGFSLQEFTNLVDEISTKDKIDIITCLIDLTTTSAQRMDKIVISS